MHVATSTLPSTDCQYLPTVAPHHLNLLEWEDKNGDKHELRIYSEISHKWRQIAELLGFKHGEIESLNERYHGNCDHKVRHVLGRWFEDAANLPLPGANKYPRSWAGLNSLLDKVQLGEVAEELRKALSSSRIK